MKLIVKRLPLPAAVIGGVGVIGVVVLIVAVVVLVGPSTSTGGPSPVRTLPSAAEIARREAAAMVAGAEAHDPGIVARDLYKAYEANEIAADQRFKDTTRVINGTVADIRKDILGAPYLILDRAEYSILAVQAMFPRSAEARLADVQQGQHVRVRCTVSGKIIGSVILQSCELL